jgi:hypothetical protein
VQSTSAILQLARVLYDEMENLDPGGDDYVAWNNLTDLEREFYRQCVKAILAHRDLVSVCLSRND